VADTLVVSLADDYGRPLAAIFVNRDITELKRLRDTLSLGAADS
jgi:hypothetical protein